MLLQFFAAGAHFIRRQDVAKETGEIFCIVGYIASERIGAACASLVYKDQVVVLPDRPKNFVGQFDQACGRGAGSAVQRKDGIGGRLAAPRFQNHKLELDDAAVA